MSGSTQESTRPVALVLSSAATALVVLAGVSCGGESAPGSHLTERDSAGVRIVESAPLDAGAVQRLVGAPALRVDGSEDGGQPLYRVGGIVALPGGRFVVASGGTHDLRYYGEDGSQEKAAGGSGQGPGEFSMLIWSQWRSPDTVVAYDSRLRRVSSYDAAGRLARELKVVTPRESPPQGAMVSIPPTVLGVLSDGHLVILGTAGLFGQGSSGPATFRATVYRDEAATGAADSVARMDVMDYYHGAPAAAGRPPFQALVFGRRIVWAVYDDGFILTNGSCYCLDEYAADGSRRRSLRVDEERLSVTAADRDAYLAEHPGDDAANPPPFASTFPAYAGLLHDHAGRIWAQRSTRPGAEWIRWDVFDEHGALTAAVEVPVHFHLLDVDSTHLYGVQTDSLDVERVEVFPSPIDP